LATESLCDLASLGAGGFHRDGVLRDDSLANRRYRREPRGRRADIVDEDVLGVVTFGKNRSRDFANGRAQALVTFHPRAVGERLSASW
jgi:hypothetical protein